MFPGTSLRRKGGKQKKGKEVEQHKTFRMIRSRLSVPQDEGTVLGKHHVIVSISLKEETVKKGKRFTKTKPQLN